MLSAEIRPKDSALSTRYLELLPMLHIDDLLRMLVESEASDLHLRVGEPPVMRIHGELKRVQAMDRLSDSDMYDLLFAVMNEDRQVRFEQNMELDMSYAVPGLARF